MHIWAEIFKGRGKKKGTSTSLAPLITQCNQLTMQELGKFAPKSKKGAISVFLKHCSELEFQKVILKSHAIFFFSLH